MSFPEPHISRMDRGCGRADKDVSNDVQIPLGYRLLGPDERTQAGDERSDTSRAGRWESAPSGDLAGDSSFYSYRRPLVPYIRTPDAPYVSASSCAIHGFRLLSEGEIIRSTDQYYYPRQRCWQDVADGGTTLVGRSVGPRSHLDYTIRRRLPGHHTNGNAAAQETNISPTCVPFREDPAFQRCVDAVVGHTRQALELEAANRRVAELEQSLGNSRASRDLALAAQHLLIRECDTQKQQLAEATASIIRLTAEQAGLRSDLDKARIDRLNADTAANIARCQLSIAQAELRRWQPPYEESALLGKPEYRDLRNGEVIQEGDQLFRGGVWHDTNIFGWGARIDYSDDLPGRARHLPHRRRLPQHGPNAHNPAGLTPAQVEVEKGYRLLDRDEVDERFAAVPAYTIDRWPRGNETWQVGLGNQGWYADSCYRTKLSRAELRRARGL